MSVRARERKRDRENERGSMREQGGWKSGRKEEGVGGGGVAVCGSISDLSFHCLFLRKIYSLFSTHIEYLFSK